VKDTIASIYGDVASPIKMNFAIAVPDASYYRQPKSINQ
jgi:hypothetical protein